MTQPTFRFTAGIFAVSYLGVLSMALFFSKGIATVPNHFLWPLALALLGLALNAIFLLGFHRRAEVSPSDGTLVFLIFNLIQAALAFALGYFLFHLPLKEALVYPMGCLVACTVWWLLTIGNTVTLSSILMLFFLGAGLVLGLRLQGVFGGLCFALALLNGFWLGRKYLLKDPVSSELWVRGIFFAALLVVGRAVIQIYLLESNYAHLGVVITHPYTYAALFLGILLPVVFWLLNKDRALPSIFLLIVLGILLPLFLGVFIHARPMAGYLLGLVTSSFIFGILFLETYWMGVLSYFNLAVIALALPLYSRLANLSRLIRLEILGAVFVLAVIGFFILQTQRRNEKS